jgi:hypothetical protein
MNFENYFIRFAKSILIKKKKGFGRGFEKKVHRSAQLKLRFLPFRHPPHPKICQKPPKLSSKIPKMSAFFTWHTYC